MHSSLQGHILIASPLLSDGNFFRSVVFIAKHDTDGAFGLILNRPSNLRLEDVIEQARGHRPKRSDSIYLGGPVEGPLLALHMMSNVGEDCQGDIWLTSDDDHLMLLCDRPKVPARFFSGYSGWGAGQLEGELAAGGWMVGPCPPEFLWGDPDDIWESAVKDQGERVVRTLVPSAGSFDPQIN